MAELNKNVDNSDEVKELRNEDPISGEAGAHPFGSGIGAAVGGAAAGAAAGLAAGPIGTVAGAVIGGVAGGLAGKAVAESIDPTVETAYWRDEYVNRPYYNNQYDYKDYEPAYRAGWESYRTEQPASFDQQEQAARERWENSTHSTAMQWTDVRPAAEDAYNRVHERQVRKPK